MSQNCATGSLAVYVPNASKPWNAARVSHLYKRLGFGASHADIQSALLQTPSQLVDDLVTAAKTAPLSPPPSWYNWTLNNYTDFSVESYDQLVEWYIHWLNEMLVTGVREKMALFWHNHFVTKFSGYICPSYLYEYHKLLQQNAFGNFPAFVKAIAKTPAMLTFLDGRLNVKNAPNENYARELLELFTMGVNNGYTQQDIEEAARALTGWTTVPEICDAISFNSSDFDNSTKTIFGQTANYDFDGVHDLIFQERAVEVSEFIARKLYTHFVHPIADDVIIDGLAQTFRNNNFELEPMILQLFKSDHFFDDEVISVHIKSPVECIVGLIKESNLQFDTTILEVAGWITIEMGQQLFDPIDVSGWNGNRAWINGTSITGRWQSLSLYLHYVLSDLDKEKYRDLAIGLSNNSTDVAYVAQTIVDHFIPKGLENAAAYNQATTALKWQIPDNYFTQGLWSLSYQWVPEQVWNLMIWMIRRPEFQLN